MIGFFDTTSLSRALFLALDNASGHHLTTAAGLLMLAAIIALLVALLMADSVAAAILRFRAGRLPSSLSERLLEEWLAEAAAASRVQKLAFALSLLCTRAHTLERACTDEEDALPEGWEVISDATAKVPADLLPRAAASLLDVMIALPLGTALAAIIKPPFPFGALDTFVVGMPIALLMHVWCVVRFGGSPGKLLMKLRIVARGDATLTLRHALMRLSPGLLFSATVAVLMFTSLWRSGLDAGAFAALSGRAQQQLQFAVAPTVLLGLVWAWDLFVLGDIFMAYHNNDHRSLRDLLAGTVVVYAVPRVVADVRFS
ncbi:MAG TPA: RDD family protein [Vicinamibacterales bacterium]|nr:RDD family protein [Vicinamibacterales bacterium]